MCVVQLRADSMWLIMHCKLKIIYFWFWNIALKFHLNVSVFDALGHFKVSVCFNILNLSWEI